MKYVVYFGKWGKIVGGVVSIRNNVYVICVWIFIYIYDEYWCIIGWCRYDNFFCFILINNKEIEVGLSYIIIEFRIIKFFRF